MQLGTYLPNFDVNVISQEHQGDHEWLGNKTNAKISDCQALKQQFCRRMNRNHFTKSNQIRMLPRDAVMEKRILAAATAMISIRMFAESSVFITVTFSPSVKFTILLAVKTRCLTLTASQKMFFSAVTHKVFMLYKLRWFI